MTLLETLLEINKAGNNSLQLTDMAVGTVESVSPLSVRMDVSQAALEASVLILTEPVVEKKLSYLGHNHTVGGSATSQSLTSIVCYDNGTALPADSNGIILNRGLAVGDKVLLLSVQQGQKFIILSRLY